MNLHSFRHAFCSAAANRGIPEATVMECLGHHSSEVTKLYYHLSDGLAQEMMAKVNFVQHAGEEGNMVYESTDPSED
ncbi:MAG: tyrosine-type recombinase/integrase [bacterium]|nr:tyrosine-type recombinase/integrase [bacterium]